MLTFEFTRPPDRALRILCVGAHSDDIEIGCGGTILRLLSEHRGAEVHWVVLGSSGERDAEAVTSAERFLKGAGKRDVIVEDILQMKAQPGGDLTLGGAGLAAAFMHHDLIDEYRIYIHPILIGRGKPLFPPSGARTRLRLTETRAFGNGVALLRYARSPSTVTAACSQRVEEPPRTKAER